MRQLRAHPLCFLLIWLIFVNFTVFGPAAAQQPPAAHTLLIPGGDIAVDVDGDFIVPTSTPLLWEVQVRVRNALARGVYENVVWYNRYDEALEIRGVRSDQGEVLSPSPNEIEWRLGTLLPGETAVLSFRLATRVTDGGEQLYSETGCGLWDFGSELHYEFGGTSGVHLSPPRLRCAVEAPRWISISLAASASGNSARPGCTPAAALVIELASNAGVSVAFDDTAPIERVADALGSALPVLRAGRDGPDPGSAERSSTPAWNTTSNTAGWAYAPYPGLAAGVTETFVRQACTEGEYPASDGGSGGLVTVTLHAGAPYVSP